jgi:hypothetical protein
VDLAIDVADANIVHIDQGQLADARAGERLHGPGTDSAETYDADVGTAQSSQAGASEQPGDSAESPLVRVHSHFNSKTEGVCHSIWELQFTIYDCAEIANKVSEFSWI